MIVIIDIDQILAVLEVENGSRLAKEPGTLHMVKYRSIVEKLKTSELDS